jgi:uncharacterized protein (TIGR00730 family)
MGDEKEKQVISVFGSHSPLPGSEEYGFGRQLGQALATAGYAVATGGYGGAMSAASQGASEASGLVIGVSSAQVESTRPVTLNRWVEEHVHYETLEERLGHLVKNNDGMVVLPGGIGTLSEFALAWSFIQVGEMSRRPLVLLGELWSETLSVFVREEYVERRHLELVHVAPSVQDAVEYIRNYL